jgi:PAS domain S-box-containing protein
VIRDAQLEIVLAASGTGLWSWDVRTGVLTWSDAIYRQHGLDPDAPAPTFKQYLDTIHPEDRSGFLAALQEAADGGRPLDLEFRIVWPDGSVHWTRGSGRLFRDAAGRPVRMLGTGQDVTERRRVEAQRDRLALEERNAAAFREAFIDVISHELRTPITTILGATQLLVRERSALDAATRASLFVDVRAESERLHRLVEDLLVLSRVERGRLVVENEPLELRRLVPRIVARTSAGRAKDITIEIERDLPIAAGEATYVEQVLRNLLGNAAKYTIRGTPIRVDVRHAGDEVEIRVIDDGPGIPTASLPHLFELYFRDPERARLASGSGIGLYVCASLVQAMGGRIWAMPGPGGGSEFAFTLRVLRGDDVDRRGDDVDRPDTPM